MQEKREREALTDDSNGSIMYKSRPSKTNHCIKKKKKDQRSKQPTPVNEKKVLDYLW